MGTNPFSVPIFFIVFRETLEAAIIVSVLLGLVEQIVHDDPSRLSRATTLVQNENDSIEKRDDASSEAPNADPASNVNQLEADPVDEGAEYKRKLIRRLRIQIFAGTGAGLLIALAIGAAFIAVWFTKASDLWSKSEDLWEGIFELIACILIFVMGVTMLKMDQAKAKWRIKLQRAFDGQHVDGRTMTGKWAFFVLPFITVLREGESRMEAVVFVGGVSLGQPATSIPLAAIVGILCGLVCGFLIYEFASRSTLRIFLIVMTNFLLLIGAGLFSKSVASFETHAYNKLVGAAIDDTIGNGPGSYRVQGNVWHLDCCNPETKTGNMGWNIFAAIFGWSNNGSLGTILSYVFYWLAVVAVLVYMKFTEGRTKLLGRESALATARRQRRDADAENANAVVMEEEKEIEALPR